MLKDIILSLEFASGYMKRLNVFNVYFLHVHIQLLASALQVYFLVEYNFYK